MLAQPVLPGSGRNKAKSNSRRNSRCLTPKSEPKIPDLEFVPSVERDINSKMTPEEYLAAIVPEISEYLDWLDSQTRAEQKL